MTAETSGPLLHNAEEASRRLGGVVSANWLMRQAAAGRIPCTQLGKFRAWSEADLEQLVRENFRDPKDYGRKARRK